MKKLLGQDASGTYAFNPTAKTVTFSGLSQAITLANILLITNVTANTIIYNFASSSTGAVSFANNVLTLDYDTTSMNSSRMCCKSILTLQVRNPFTTFFAA
jgi:GDP-D-mannose dehydratase